MEATLERLRRIYGESFVLIYLQGGMTAEERLALLTAMDPAIKSKQQGGDHVSARNKASSPGSS